MHFVENTIGLELNISNKLYWNLQLDNELARGKKNL